jgi:NAD(P)-dependent dehydrogenase (short-subunit alcohol dehydrogenase family)
MESVGGLIRFSLFSYQKRTDSVCDQSLSVSATARRQAHPSIQVSCSSLDNAKLVDEIATYAKQHHVDLRTIELDVQPDVSATAAVQQIMAAHGRLDVLIHNAGHMVWGCAKFL